MKNEYVPTVINLLTEIEVQEEVNIIKAAQLVANSIMNDVIIIAFGSSHLVVKTKEIVMQILKRDKHTEYIVSNSYLMQ